MRMCHAFRRELPPAAHPQRIHPPSQGLPAGTPPVRPCSACQYGRPQHPLPTPSVYAARPGIYLQLTKRRQGDNRRLATVRSMTTDLHLHHQLGVRPGESDSAGMLSRVLVLLAAVVLMAALAWWLA